MGTPALGEAMLQALIEARYNLVGVVTQPDRPVGRQQKLAQSPVKILAERHQLPLIQPERFDDTTLTQLKNWKPDLVVVAAYGRILPAAVLSLPGFGCINVHTSLLPRWRGASPIQNALLAGDKETGVSLMLLDQGMDTGPLLATRACSIKPDDRTDTLTAKLTTLGQALLIETLPRWIVREIQPTPQPTEGVTLCQLIEREDGHIFWDTTAQEIYNRYRGLYPWPGIFTYWQRGENDLVRIKLQEIGFQKTQPTVPRKLGEVFEIGDGFGVQTSLGVVLLITLQAEGKSSMPIADFVRGNPTLIGSTLTA